MALGQPPRASSHGFNIQGMRKPGHQHQRLVVVILGVAHPRFPLELGKPNFRSRQTRLLFVGKQMAFSRREPTQSCHVFNGFTTLCYNTSYSEITCHKRTTNISPPAQAKYPDETTADRRSDVASETRARLLQRLGHVSGAMCQSGWRTLFVKERPPCKGPCHSLPLESTARISLLPRSLHTASTPGLDSHELPLT